MEGEEEEDDVDGGDDPLVENNDEVPPDDTPDDASCPLADAETHEGDSEEAVVCMAEPVMTWPDNQLGLEDSQGDADATLFYEPAEPNEPVSTAPSGSDASGEALKRATPLDLTMVDLCDFDDETGGACLNLNPPVHNNSTSSPVIQRWCVLIGCAMLFLCRW